MYLIIWNNARLFSEYVPLNMHTVLAWFVLLWFYDPFQYRGLEILRLFEDTQQLSKEHLGYIRVRKSSTLPVYRFVMRKRALNILASLCYIGSPHCKIARWFILSRIIKVIQYIPCNMHRVLLLNLILVTLCVYDDSCDLLWLLHWYLGNCKIEEYGEENDIGKIDKYQFNKITDISLQRKRS